MLNSLIECPICCKQFEDPVLLPCSHTVCQKHALNRSSQVRCPTCHQEHQVPERGFPFNGLAQALLERQFEKISLKPEHKAATQSFHELKTLVDDIKRMRDHPDVEIHQVLNDLRNKIDLRREEAKKAIDDESLKLVDELNKFESERKEAAKSDNLATSETNEMIKSLEVSLDEWKKEIDTFAENTERWVKIHEETIDKYKKLRPDFDRIRASLFSKDQLDELIFKQKKFCGRNVKPLL